MRLTPQEIAAIHEAVATNFGPGASVWLFGSRADDAQRGGDIDLYIEPDRPVSDRVLKICGTTATIQQKIGLRKIDIVVSDPSQDKLPIYEVAKARGVRL